MNTVLITLEQFLQLCPRVDRSRAQTIVAHLNTICPTYGLDTKDEFHEFFATLCEESAEFTRFEENLNYSSRGMMRVWPNRFPSLASTLRYVRNPQDLANKVYGGRMGNTYPEDGWDFRGSGPIMITGRANVTAFGKYMKETFGIDHTPELWAIKLRSNIEYGIHSACWIFSVVLKLNDDAMNDDMRSVTRRVNGGYTNYSKRIWYLERAESIIV
jgi:putative chitinase